MHSILLLSLFAALSQVPSPLWDFAPGACVRRASVQASGVVDWTQQVPASSWYGAPTPTVDCVAAVSGGDMTCTGATVTKHGSPTTTTAYGLPVQNAVNFASGADWFDLGTVHPTSGFTVLTVYATNDVSGGGWRFLGGNDDAGARSWSLVHYYGQLRFLVAKDAGHVTQAVIASVNAGEWNVVCASWDESGGVDAGVMTFNVNGTGTSYSSLPAPMMTPTAHLQIGYGGDPASYFVGSIERFTVLPKSSTAGECAQMVASQQARLTKKPAGGLVSWTSDPQLCCPVDDAHCYNLAANQLCVGTAGTGIWGAAERSNLLTRSEPGTGWTLTDSTVVAADAACPMDPTGAARMTSVTTSSATGLAKLAAATGTCEGVWMALATDDSACTVTLSDSTGAGAAAITLTATPVRSMQYAAGNSGIRMARATTGCARWCVFRATSQASTVCTVSNPAPATAGVAYVGNATVATVATTLTDPSRWCVGVRATAANFGSASANPYLLAAGALGAASSFFLRTAGDATTYLAAYDASAGEKYVVAPKPTGGSEHKIVACNFSGALSIYMDSVLVSGGAVGAGTGIIASIPADLLIGAAPNGLSQINGSISKVCQGKSYAEVARCLQ